MRGQKAQLSPCVPQKMRRYREVCSSREERPRGYRELGTVSVVVVEPYDDGCEGWGQSRKGLYLQTHGTVIPLDGSAVSYRACTGLWDGTWLGT